jgi:predicted deacylase
MTVFSLAAAGKHKVMELPVPNSSVSIPVHLLVGTQPGPRVAIMACVHGDEYEGPLALGRLLRELGPDRLRAGG